MRKMHQNWLTLALVALILTSGTCRKNVTIQESYGDALEAIFGLGIRLQLLLDDPSNSKNFVVSPFSVAVVIAQLMLGAEGDFLRRLHELMSLPTSRSTSTLEYFSRDKNNASYQLSFPKLHVQLSALSRKLEGNPTTRLFTLQTANALFLNERLELTREFEHNVKHLYSTSILPVNYATESSQAQTLINNWVSNQTNGIINSFLGAPPPAETSAILANTIYMKADWETPFGYESNRDDVFRCSETKNITTTFMINFMEQIPFIRNKRFTMIGLPYTNNELVMYVVLPKDDHEHKYNISAFARTLKIQEITEAISHMKKRNILVMLPKLSLKNTIDILEPLQRYNAYKKANPNNERSVVDPAEELNFRVQNYTPSNTEIVREDIFLTNAALNHHLQISDIFQQVFLRVDENGTEAAAATGTLIDYMGSEDFITTRPFAFFIRHEATEATLFWGTIVDPSQS